MKSAARPADDELLRIVIDDRESASGLPSAVASLWPETFVTRLDVGDVAVGGRILVERKTARDFVVSLEDGRLFRQEYALNRCGGRPIMVVEMADGICDLGLTADALRGVLLSLMVGYRIPLFYTASLEETAATVAHIARQERRRLARARHPPVAAANRPAADILRAIPGVGADRAQRLADEFGSVRAIANSTPAQLARVEGIGPKTAEAATRVLRGTDSET